MYTQIKRFLFGNPLQSHLEEHERLSIFLGLAVFASDALSSTAYATEEILIALVGTVYAVQANLLSLPVAIAIALLIAIVVTSYRQVIHAYPDGGGAYVVAKDNIGVIPCLIAGAALLLDYILTVAVSISAGVAALTSTGLVSVRISVPLSVFLVFVMTLINLRGVRESGKVIAIPAYTFIASIYIMLALGIWESIHGIAPVSHTIVATASATTTTNLVLNMTLILILLKAFSHGCAALTGIEAVSNGVRAFKEPAPVNANRTMVLMGVILGSMFIGITYLAFAFHIYPNPNETVVSQVARHTFGGSSPMYFVVQVSTMIILVLAANTSYAGFPRLASLLAYDGFLPRQLMNLGDRLVFSNGIILLGLVSGLLIILYQANTNALIPLYAVGVFMSFTLAQAGMVIHHRRHKAKDWQMAIVIKAVGCVATGLVTILLAVEKFAEGAWIVLLAIPLMIFVFLKIYYHYKSIAKQLALPVGAYYPKAIEHTALVLVSSLNRGTIPALEYAKTISEKVEAVHVELNPIATNNLKKAWSEWGSGIPLVILKSPYRSITEPLMEYISEVEGRYEEDLVTIIVPEFVTKKFWHNLLHNQTAIQIKAMLRNSKGKVVTTVRYYLEE